MLLTVNREWQEAVLLLLTIVFSRTRGEREGTGGSRAPLIPQCSPAGGGAAAEYYFPTVLPRRCRVVVFFLTHRGVTGGSGSCRCPVQCILPLPPLAVPGAAAGVTVAGAAGGGSVCFSHALRKAIFISAA